MASPPEAKLSTPESPCGRHLETARTELLARGFSPTRETSRWLRVLDDQDSVELSLVMRTSADGAASWYVAKVTRGKFRASSWKRSDRPHCCDEHANPEDKLRELQWARRSASADASLSIVYFSDDNTPEELRERALFEELAKAALQRCLE